MTTKIITHNAWLEVLSSIERSPEIAAADDLYGWVIGSWELDVRHYAAVDVTALRIQGEAHFARVLEGRGVQDIWIMPQCSERTADLDKTNNMYGTTLRVWDPSIHAWRITWINPATGHREEQIGRRKDNDIVQVGTRSNGTPTRWRFTEITPDSFHWIGEALNPDGETWKLEGEFQAHRMRYD